MHEKQSVWWAGLPFRISVGIFIPPLSSFPIAITVYFIIRVLGKLLPWRKPCESVYINFAGLLFLLHAHPLCHRSRTIICNCETKWPHISKLKIGTTSLKLCHLVRVCQHTLWGTRVCYVYVLFQELSWTAVVTASRAFFSNAGQSHIRASSRSEFDSVRASYTCYNHCSFLLRHRIINFL